MPQRSPALSVDDAVVGRWSPHRRLRASLLQAAGLPPPPVSRKTASLSLGHSVERLTCGSPPRVPWLARAAWRAQGCRTPEPAEHRGAYSVCRSCFTCVDLGADGNRGRWLPGESRDGQRVPKQRWWSRPVDADAEWSFGGIGEVRGGAVAWSAVALGADGGRRSAPLGWGGEGGRSSPGQ